MWQLFQLLSIFDCVTPIANFLEDIAHDPTPLQSNSWTFFIPYGDSIRDGWNAVGVEDLMRRNGIEIWGRQVTNGELFFSVKLEQAQWAEYLLTRHGVSMNEKFLGAPRKVFDNTVPLGKIRVVRKKSIFQRFFG